MSLFDKWVKPLQEKAQAELSRGVDNLSDKASDTWAEFLSGADESTDSVPVSRIAPPRQNVSVTAPVIERENVPAPTTNAKRFVGGINWAAVGAVVGMVSIFLAIVRMVE